MIIVAVYGILDALHFKIYTSLPSIYYVFAFISLPIRINKRIDFCQEGKGEMLAIHLDKWYCRQLDRLIDWYKTSLVTETKTLINAILLLLSA